MRILSLVALAACVSNPDPRNVTQQQVLRDGHGGWIEIVHADGSKGHGELIAVTPTRADQLRRTVITEPIATFKSAELFEYDTGNTASSRCGAALARSARSPHGFFAVISIPVWLATTITTSAFSRSRA